MNYVNMAMVYDILMTDAPYDKWVDYVKRHSLTMQKPIGDISLLDVGCGTGELAVRLKKDGFLVSGVDLSETMLSIARQKAESLGLRIPLFQQDMTELQFETKFDIITIFCDSINYLHTKEDIARTYKSCYSLLNDGGLLLVDVHSPYKIEQLLGNEPFYEVGDEVTYIWSCEEGEYPNSVIHDLTFFVLNKETGEYQRFDEWHQQQTYPLNEWEQLLDAAGFSLLSTTADFVDDPPSFQSERIFFCAKK